MHYTQKFILFLFLIAYAIFSFAEDSTRITRLENATPMHRTAHVDINNTIPRGVTYTPEGHQILQPCPSDHSIVHIKNASDKVYWGPPEALIIFGECSDFGCWCAGSPHSCCAWCDPPIVRVDKIKWQTRPSQNQGVATYENLPSVLSEAGCAPIKTTWERVS